MIVYPFGTETNLDSQPDDGGGGGRSHGEVGEDSLPGVVVQHEELGSGRLDGNEIACERWSIDVFGHWSAIEVGATD